MILVFGQTQSPKLLEVQPKHFLTPTFLLQLFFCIFSFNLHFDLVINSALDLFLFFHKNFSVTLLAIANASSILLLNWKQSWDMENTCSSWCRMIWARNAFASKKFSWDNYDVVAFALSTYPWRGVFWARRQSLSIVIFVRSYHVKLYLLLLSTDCLLGFSEESV